MKKGLAVIVAFIPCFLIAQTSFTLSGSLNKLKDTVKVVYLDYISGNARISDSSKVVDGKYSFKGMLDEPTLGRITAGLSKNNAAEDIATSIYLQPGNISVTSTGSFTSIAVKGSSAHDDFKKFEDIIQPYSDTMRYYYQVYSEARQTGNTAKMQEIQSKAMKLEAYIKEKVFVPYIKNNPSSPVSFFVLQQYAGNDIDVNKVEPLFATLSPAVQNLSSAKQLKERINIEKRTAIGQIAADFTQNDTLGNPVKLSSLRGKYLLVDFWASWCGPCRQENPNVVNVYNKFKDKGFTVLGVSLDKQNAKDAWLKAIHDDNLTWTHVSDLQFWNNAAARLYGIESIPQNFLLDPQGKIIGKNLRGAELLETLEEVLGK
ncbi:alkyl hydroperoxide reductase [Terrimonas sp.]|uniref:TlpA disulfide reductase family protein n=1 Tax=Terrimonas sp. TaxID=1914338 RepID=UPI000D515889|nr:TlpA disulfide reductase family protein [Terrimonas sp.]PVD51407.1 alkyl hydroperoxide reductase [Terrimonas sp.]